MGQENRDRFMFTRIEIVFIVIFVLLSATAFLYDTPSISSSGSGPIPVLMNSLDTPSVVNANAVAVDDSGFAYLLMKESSLGPEFYTIDVSNAVSPRIVGSLELGIPANALAVSGDYAYVVTNNGTRELVVIDISNKSAPSVVRNYDIAGGKNAITVSIDGARAYVGTTDAIYVFDASTPSAPQLLGSQIINTPVNDIVARGDYAFVVTPSTFRVFSVVNPQSVAQTFSYTLPATGNSVDYSNGMIYLATANGNSGVRDFYIFDATTNQAQPQFVSSLDLGSPNIDIAVYGSKAYVATKTNSKGLTVVDVENANTPQVYSAFDTLSETNGVALNGAYVFLATSADTAELKIVNPRVPLKPNIIVIMTDDQRWDTLQYLPNVSRLASEGMTFINSFTTTPLCCPSRASFFTGQYGHNHGVKGQFPPLGGAPMLNASSTIATWLHDAGYTTGLFGKYLNGYHLLSPQIPPGWDSFNAFLDNNLNLYYNYTLNENGILTTYGNTSVDYSTDVLRDKAIQFIRSNTIKPFYVELNPFAPHWPPIPAPRHIGAFATITPWRPPSYGEADVSDKPSYIKNAATAWIPEKGEAIDQQRIDALESLLAVDDAVGMILDTLDELGLTRNTIIVFTSDHGYGWGEHWWNMPEAPYEELIRVPLVVRYPLIIPPVARQSDQLALNIDIAPTFAELAGAVPQTAINGKSIVDILRGLTPSWRTDFLLEYWPWVYGDPVSAYQGVRSKDAVYIKYASMEELYDLRSDPYQLQNVAKNSAYSALLTAMRTRLTSLVAE